MWRGPRWLTVFRDVVLLVLPTLGFAREVFRDKPSVEILVACMAALSAPGLLGTGWLARHGTELPSPPSPSPPSTQQPSSSSPSGS